MKFKDVVYNICAGIVLIAIVACWIVVAEILLVHPIAAAALTPLIALLLLIVESWFGDLKRYYKMQRSRDTVEGWCEEGRFAPFPGVIAKPKNAKVVWAYG